MMIIDHPSIIPAQAGISIGRLCVALVTSDSVRGWAPTFAGALVVGVTR